MKILLVYPKYPETFWSLKHVLRFVGKKAFYPPLGLLTVASMLPPFWEKKLKDMNVENLKDEDFKWADYVFISAMLVQENSVREVIEKCQKFSKKIVAGGPLFTVNYQDFDDVDYFVLGEAETTLPLFLADLEKGCPKHLYYETVGKADLTKTPFPSWDLINMKKYLLMSIQYSRGCPFNCEFCDIALISGRFHRTKTKEQIMSEFDILYNHGWRRGGVFFVDDNFISDKEKLKKEILPAIIDWMKQKEYPFTFSTEASVNLADDEQLIDLMVEAGFKRVFLGIETMEEESLTECGKLQNRNRDLISSVQKIQRKGIEVMGGFIVGFDHDSPSIFERQIQFIKDSGIVTATVGILTALRNTRLYQRLKNENRLLKESHGENTKYSLNFTPKMGREMLINGYKKIIKTIYSPEHYYQRIIDFLKIYRYSKKGKNSFNFSYFTVFPQLIWFLGIQEGGGIYFWKLIFWLLIKKPQHFYLAMELAVQGYHFRKFFNQHL